MTAEGKMEPTAAGAVASRRTGSNQAVIRIALEACEAACRLCAKECDAHAPDHEHCRICAEACRACEHACHLADAVAELLEADEG